MRINYFLVLIFLAIGVIECQPNSILLSSTIYDESPFRNLDFEIGYYYNGLVPGIVLPVLGSDGTPTYCCGDSSVTRDNLIVVHNNNTFYSWFHSVPGVNIPLSYDLILERVGNSNTFQFLDNSFFPIDGKGFNNATLYPNQPPLAHNYFFCLKTHYSFNYAGGEFFYVSGDDDTFVFFNDVLAIDLGGIHTTRSQTVYLDDLGLIPGTDYPFDFFHCERHTTQSNLNIITNLNFTCSFFDACGVCNGNGDTCCAVNQCETPLNKCLVQNCGPENNYQCEFINRDCTSNSTCSIGACSPGAGCYSYPVNCDDGNYCTLDSCVEGTGCVHEPIENCAVCPIGSCASIDPCNPRECNPLGTFPYCITRSVNCSTGVDCLIGACSQGQCIFSDFCPIGPIFPDPSDLFRTITPLPTNTPYPAYPPPKGLGKHCLKCEDLNCRKQGQQCTYIKNETIKKEKCGKKCCLFTPTCYPSIL